MEFKIQKPFEGNFPISFRFGEAPKWYIDIAGYPHNGADWAMPVGVQIKPAENGVVMYADNVPDGNGLGINIMHEWGMSQYWHLSKVFANLGDQVNRGTIIGLSGASGWVTGSHLHFGVKEKDNTFPPMRGWVDPILHLTEVPVEPVPPASENAKYLVLPGDSLWKIAVKFYGQGTYWKRIYDANKIKIANPNNIRPFQILYIP